MNILYIAYSCDPQKGSEDKIGWNIPVTNAQTTDHNVFVITKEEHRQGIENYLRKNNIENINFHYVDIPSVYKKIFRGFLYSGRLNIWHRRAIKTAERLVHDHDIQIIHQITPIEFRAVGNYGNISGVKFICGPLGGGESIPIGLRTYIGKNLYVEAIRYCMNYLANLRYRMSHTLSHCDMIMFANKETRDFLGLDGPIFTEIGISKNEISTNNVDHCESDKITFLVAGRIIYRKGHHFLFDALEKLPSNMEYECRIVGDGPELSRLKKRCENSKKLSAHVRFVGNIPYNQMEDEYNNADLLIMPSLRETTGTVILEAMARGVPVITIDKFGGARIVKENSGWLYSGNSRNEYVDALSNILLDCVSDSKLIVKQKGNIAVKAINDYMWKQKCKKYHAFYQKLMSDR